MTLGKLKNIKALVVVAAGVGYALAHSRQERHRPSGDPYQPHDEPPAPASASDLAGNPGTDF